MDRHKDTFGYLSLSIDGATATIHDEIRNKKGSFARTVASAKEYIHEGYKLKIASTLNRNNKGEMEALVNLAIEIGASSIIFCGYDPYPVESRFGVNGRRVNQLMGKSK